MFADIGVHKKILIRTLSGAVQIAPLLISKFSLVAPCKRYDLEKFNLRFSDPGEMTEVADKLKWYRYKKEIRQQDVADFAGLDRSTYSGYEEYGRDYYPIEPMRKIAKLLEVGVEDLLDEYNAFLYHGQAEQIQALRLSRGLTQKAFAELLGVNLWNYKRWEQGRVQISKSTWTRLFQNSDLKKQVE